MIPRIRSSIYTKIKSFSSIDKTDEIDFGKKVVGIDFYRLISFAIKAIEEIHTRLFNFYLASNYMTSFDVTVTSLLSKFVFFLQNLADQK